MSNDALAPSGSESADSGEVETTREDVSQESQESNEEKPVSFAGTKHRVKIDDEEAEVPYEELVAGYQKARSSGKRYDEAAQMVKSVQPDLEIVKALKSGDLRRLEKLGVPPEAIRKYAEETLMNYIDEQENPERAELNRLKREAEDRKAEDDRRKASEEESRRGQLAQQAAVETEAEIVGALKEADIPLKGNYRLVRRMAESMLAELETSRGKKKLPAKEALNRTMKGIDEDFVEHIERKFGKDPKTFIESLPKHILDGIRKRDLETVQSQLPIGKKNDFEPKPRKNATRDAEWDAYRKEGLQRRG